MQVRRRSDLGTQHVTPLREVTPLQRPLVHVHAHAAARSRRPCRICCCPFLATCTGGGGGGFAVAVDFVGAVLAYPRAENLFTAMQPKDRGSRSNR